VGSEFQQALPSLSFPETGGRGAIYRALAGTGRNELRHYEGRKYAVRKKLREGKSSKPVAKASKAGYDVQY